jgi:hypothetical protein
MKEFLVFYFKLWQTSTLIMLDEISTKNTKNEILEAYHEALRQLKESKKAGKQQEKLEEDKKQVIE